MKIKREIIFGRIGMVFLVFAMLGCSRGPVMEEYQALPDNNWNRFQTIWFDYVPGDSRKVLQLELFFRYSEAFAGDRIDFMATIHAPSGEQRFKEYHYTTRDRDGRITGKAPEATDQSAAWYEGVVMLRKDFVFQESGLYRIEIENLMSKYDNKGILGVGLRIDKSGE